MSQQWAVGYQNETLREQALALANKLNLRIDNNACQQLLLTPDKLTLKLHPFLPMYADFTMQTWQKRHDAGKKQGLVRACKPMLGMRIIDATAGWGRDAAVLASFGAEVTMIERHPIMAALLADALEHRDDHSKALLNLTVINEDAQVYLHALATCDYPDVIYIDPMHPSRDKTALVKKDLQILQQLIGTDKNALNLIQLARTRVLKKVVVKWPQQLAPLLPANASITGKTVRFDLYTAC